MLQVVAARITHNPYRHRVDEWHQALAKKKKAALEMLEAQKVIEEVEAEAAEHMPKTIIAHLRSQSYPLEDISSLEGHFVAAISDIILTPTQG